MYVCIVGIYVYVYVYVCMYIYKTHTQTNTYIVFQDEREEIQCLLGTYKYIDTHKLIHELIFRMNVKKFNAF